MEFKSCSAAWTVLSPFNANKTASGLPTDTKQFKKAQIAASQIWGDSAVECKSVIKNGPRSEMVISPTCSSMSQMFNDARTYLENTKCDPATVDISIDVKLILNDKDTKLKDAANLLRLFVTPPVRDEYFDWKTLNTKLIQPALASTNPNMCADADYYCQNIPGQAVNVAIDALQALHPDAIAAQATLSLKAYRPNINLSGLTAEQIIEINAGMADLKDIFDLI